MALTETLALAMEAQAPHPVTAVLAPLMVAPIHLAMAALTHLAMVVLAQIALQAAMAVAE